MRGAKLRGMMMRKSAIILFVVAALFLISSISFIAGGEILYFVIGLVIAVVIAFFGYRQLKKPAPAKFEAKPAQSTQTTMPIKATIASMSNEDRTPYTEAPFKEIVDGIYKLKYTYGDVKVAMANNRDKVRNRVPVKFIPEPDNAYDDKAVAVHIGSKTQGFTHIGYLHRGKLQDMYHDFSSRNGDIVGCVHDAYGENLTLFIGFYERLKEQIISEDSEEI